jgi:hypothetical protein
MYEYRMFGSQSMACAIASGIYLWEVYFAELNFEGTIEIR